MIGESRVRGASALIILSTGAERASGLLVTVLIGRVLGPQSLGEYSLVLALWNVFAVLAYFGQGKQIARDIARWPDQAAKLLGTSTMLALVASVVAGALMLVTSIAFGYSNVVIMGTAIAAASFLWADSQCATIEAMLISLDRVPTVAAINLGASTMRAAAGLTMLIWRIDVVAMLALIGVTQIGTALALRIAASRAVNGRQLRWDGTVASAYARGAVVFTLSGVATIVFKRMDALLLESILGAAALGIYSAAYRVAQAAHALAPPIFRVAAPFFARARAVSLRSTAALTHERLRSLGLMFGLLSAGMALSGPPILLRVYGPAFAASTMPLIALSAATLPLTVNGLFTIIALATNLETQMLRVNIINGAISLALNLILIPVMGPTGSALALLLAAVAGLGQGGELLRREGMLSVREGAAAIAPAAMWTGLATVGAVFIELARLAWPVTAFALMVSCGGLVWSYRAVAADMLRPAAKRLERIDPIS